MSKIFKQWITKNSKNPFYARKVINISSRIKKATITICGLGQFQLFINGKKVSDRVLDPAWTDYDKLVNYVYFDITDYLNEGKNVIAAEVGNGWFIMDEADGYIFHFPPFMPPNPNPYRPFGQALVLAAHVEVEYADGTTDFFDADETWKVADHPITNSNCFGSEIIDGRKKISGWNDLSLDDSNWSYASIAAKEDEPKGKITEQIIPPVKVMKTYEGKYLHTVNGKAIYDFGQNTSGMLRFSVKGQAGQKINVYPAEKLDSSGDADQMAKNWMMINVKDTYIIGNNDVWEDFDMTFTYICCRYVAIEGCDRDSIKNPELRAVTSATEKAGEFWCDDARIMQIYRIVESAVESNMVSVHTDCPTIERFAWQEENHLMAPSIMYMKSVKPHWEKFLTDTRVSQHGADDFFRDMQGGKFYPGEGLIPSQAPCYMPNVLPVPGMGSFYDIIGWGSSIIIGTYWHYRFYGDINIIKDNYDAGKKYLEYLKTRVTEDGFINHGLGDWGNPVGMLARENVETAFLYADAKILSEFAGLLGKEKDRDEIKEYADSVKDIYNEKLLVYDKTAGRYCYRVWGQDDAIVTTQASQAMPLFWGMVPKDKEADIAASLKAAMLSAGCFQTGEVGQPYIIQTLARYGMNDIIADFILKEQHPSYYAFVLDGETSLGEYWEENPRSHCHDMMGHIIEWFYSGMAGINAIEPGFKKVLIKPYMPESVNEIKCTYHSINGPISIHMKREGQEISLDVEAAEGIEIHKCLTGGRNEIS